jgi:hypothetical protein
VPGLGKFKAQDNVVSFCVALDLLASGKYKFLANDQNVSPISASAMRFYSAEALSITAISVAAETTKAEAA